MALPILDKHYSEAQRRKDDEWAIAALPPASIIHHAEDGSPIDEIVELMQRAMATRVVQRHGRRYALQIIRWLAFLITDLADLAVDTRRLDAFFGLKEAFEIFLTDEKYLINRKVLSIYAR